MKAWLTRDKSGALKLHTSEVYLCSNISGMEWFESTQQEVLKDIDFPFVTFENSPIQFEVKDTWP